MRIPLTQNWKILFFLALAAIVTTTLLLTMGDSARVHAQSPDDDTQKYANMDPLLNELVQQYETGEFTASAAAANAPVSSEASVGVIFTTESGEADDIRDFLLENGASPGPAFDGFLGADVPVSLLAEASQQNGVTWMQASVPGRVVQDEEEPADEDLAEHGVDLWHAAGIRGAGVKIAVIGLGFDGIQDMLGTELPQTVTARCYTGYGLFSTDIEDCETGAGIGSTRAQRIFDVAPDATYYIATIGDWVDLHDAVKWLVAEEVDVVYNSVIWLYTGPGDGTSPYALSDLNSVDDAIEGGITWVMPAGNDAKSTWFGAFKDEDGNGYHEFNDDDECNSVELEAGEVYMGIIRWEDKWVGPFDPEEYRDLDLLLVDEDSSTRIRRSYRSFLARTAPLEYFRFYPRQGGNYCLQIRLNVGTAPDWVQVQSFLDGDLEHPSYFGSIASPAESNNPGMISVGVSSPDDPDEIWERSSRGPGPEPWPEGRIKPEIVVGYGDTSGTSLATHGTGWGAAYVAGIAALVKQRFHDFEPEDVADYLKSNAEDKGDPGPDNTWGYGFVLLPASDAAAPPEPDVCIQRIYGDQTIEGVWDDTCLSEKRPVDENREGEGDYYARYYTIAVGENKRVTINLSSEEDTYLYLLEGEGKDGEIVASNDDATPYIDLNSRIVVDNLEAGAYTIEAATYHTETGGEFTLSVQVSEAGEEPEPVPEPAPSARGPFGEFSRGADHVCALQTSGRISCWGGDDYGQSSPPSGEYTAISSGEDGSCALRDDGAAVCWGSFEVSPATDDNAAGPFTEVSRGSDHACALDSDGGIACWGSDRRGQATPPSGEFSAISSHENGSCALRNDDALVCWGSFEVSP